jgi:protein-L-isoaspartate(D-aspartate) O-methyltransferase
MEPTTREALLAELVRDGYLKSPSVTRAFAAVDRAVFVPVERKEEAYGNYPLPIGYGQTISQPLTVAFMLELLDAKPGEKVLEVGAGSGWQTALLSNIVGSEGTVIGMERLPELVSLAERNIAEAKVAPLPKAAGEASEEVPAPENIRLVLGDGSLGFSEGAPYDRIIAAAAANTIPPAWKEELRIGGRIVAPIRESIMVLTKTAHDAFEIRQYFGFSFVPLVKD